MPNKKRFSVEQIISHLREAEVFLAQGQTIGRVCRHIGISEQSYYRWRDTGLVFTTKIGTPFDPRNVTRHFKKILTNAGFRKNDFMIFAIRAHPFCWFRVSIQGSLWRC